MGLYDYVGGEQIKIFPVPHVYQGNVVYSGGSLTSFGDKDELPLKTLFYQYPNDFVVYDFRWIDNDEFEYIWIIKNGKFSHFRTLDTLTSDDLVGPVYNYYGSPLNIRTVEDFRLIHIESEEATKKDKENEWAIFPNGSINMIRDNFDLYQEKEAEWRKIQFIHTRAFTEKWYREEDHPIEEKFGAAIQCYIDARIDLSDEEDEYFKPKERFQEVVTYIQKFTEEHPNIVSSYCKWLNNEQLLEKIGFDVILSEIRNSK